MHIEGHFGESLVYTLLGRNTRLDLIAMGVRKKLQPVDIGDKTYFPPACFTLSPIEKVILCEFIRSVKFLDGYASNISSRIRVKEKKILGLKTHDWHILLQYLLPLVIRKVTPPTISRLIIEIGNYFRELCSKVLRVSDLRELEKRVALTLCQLERIFPPSFFDIMIHLPIHLATEAKIAGLVHFRWMYPPKRFQMILKSYVRNKTRPEGSIAKGYLIEETLTFCSQYLTGVDTKLNRLRRNDDGNELQRHECVFPQVVRPLGGVTSVNLDYISYEQVHRYVLFNCGSLDSYIEKHLEELRNKHRWAQPKDIEKTHNEIFHRWFKNYVLKLVEKGETVVPEDIKLLASGPTWDCRSFKGYLINGYRFHIKDVEEGRTTQSSGVMVITSTFSFSSSKDNNPMRADVVYYGFLKEILELNYGGKEKFVLFKCDWADVKRAGRGTKKDEFGSTLVNFSELLYNGNLSDEPFVFASQVRQVFYVQDPIDRNWHFVVFTTPRDFFDMSIQNFEDDTKEPIADGLDEVRTMTKFSVNEDEDTNLTRDDIQGTTINTSLKKLLKEKEDVMDVEPP